MLEILLEEKKRHPAAEARDLCKLLYQSEFGAGHMAMDAEAGLARLRAECAACGAGEDEPITDVGGGLVRLHLRALPALKLRLETVNGLFARACAPRGSVAGLEAKLELLRANAARLGLNGETLEAELAAWRAAGYPALSHSRAYRDLYHPAYRLVPASARRFLALFQAIDAMAESVQRDIASFGAWPLSLKAEYARDIAPRVRAIVDSGDLTPLDNGAGPNLYVIAAAAYDYGLPGEGDLAQEDALERARETVRERFGLSQEALSRYTDVLVYFDATDPDAPLWRFVFQPEMDARDALGQTQYDLRYRVEIASPAGDVASAEAFKRQVPVYDLSYLMNLY